MPSPWGERVSAPGWGSAFSQREAWGREHLRRLPAHVPLGQGPVWGLGEAAGLLLLPTSSPLGKAEGQDRFPESSRTLQVSSSLRVREMCVIAERLF